MPIFNVAVAAFLYWHPGFAADAAYTVLMIVIAFGFADGALKHLRESGGANAAFYTVFAVPFTIILWDQPFVSHQRALGIYLTLTVLALALVVVALRAQARARRVVAYPRRSTGVAF